MPRLNALSSEFLTGDPVQSNRVGSALVVGLVHVYPDLSTSERFKNEVVVLALVNALMSHTKGLDKWLGCGTNLRRTECSRFAVTIGLVHALIGQTRGSGLD